MFLVTNRLRPFQWPRLREKVVAAVIMFVVLLLTCRLLCGGEPHRVTVQPGLVELRLPSAPAAADITWEARQPLTLPFKVYESGTVLVTYATAGEIVVSSDVIDWDARKRDKTTWVVTVAGTPPTPPAPIPPEPPAPDPTPDEPAPIPDPGLRVLVVYESQHLPRMPPAQRAILYDADVRAWMSQHCVRVNGYPEWRIADQNSPVVMASDIWVKAMARPRTSVPWLIVSNGTTGYEGPLPATKADMLALLRKYGGQ